MVECHSLTHYYSNASLLTCHLPRLSPSGAGVSGGGGRRGSADVLESFQAAIVFSDRVPVQAAETGENI